MDPFKKVVPGSPLAISAAAWNAVQDAAREYRRRRAGGLLSGPLAAAVEPSHTVLVSNQTGSPLSERAVLALGTPTVSAVDDPFGVQARPLFPGTLADSTSDPFGILLEPLDSSKVGRAVVGGVAVCDLNVTDSTHTHARPSTTSTAVLDSAAAGPAKIVWKESGTGTKRAVVLIDQAGGSGGAVTNGELAVAAFSPAATLNWEDASGDLELPEAGTYLLWACLLCRLEVTAGGHGPTTTFQVRLRDTTAAAVVEGTHTIVSNVPTSDTDYVLGATVQTVYTVDEASDIRLQAWKSGVTWVNSTVEGAGSPTLGSPIGLRYLKVG